MVSNGASEGVRHSEDGTEHVIVDEEAWRGHSLEDQHDVAGKVHGSGATIWSRGG